MGIGNDTEGLEGSRSYGISGSADQNCENLLLGEKTSNVNWLGGLWLAGAGDMSN